MLRHFKNAPTRESAGRDLVDPEVLDSIARSYVSASESDRRKLEEQFSLALHNLRMAGVYKRTNPRRLPLTEAAILELVPNEFRDECRILDIGASDGITTVELLERLRASWGSGVSAVMADINLWVERYRLGPVLEYREASGDQVLVRLGDRAFRTVKEEPTEKGLSRTKKLRGIARSSYWHFWRATRPWMRFAGRLSLVNPRAVTCPGLEPRVLNCLVRDDSLIEGFHCVRASNILNIDYFRRDQLRLALVSLHAYLKEGGGLVISRNEGDVAEETEHGTFWVKAGDQFVTRGNFGRGSEIKDLVDAFRAP